MIPLSFKLPACASPAQGLTVAATSGLIAAALQWGLSSVLLKRNSRATSARSSSSTKLQKESAQFTAHSVVALMLMLLLSTMGTMGWWFSNATAPVNNKLLDVSSTGRWMAAVVLGCFLLWDIPTSIRVKPLRKADVIVHHVVMMILAAIGTTLLPMQYIFYHFGVVELSSIPLIGYDQVTYWIEKYGNDDSNNNTKLQQWTKLQSILGPLTGVAFVMVRIVSFTKVTFCNFLPDCRLALARKTAILASPPQRRAIQFLMVACTLFTLLQWFWFSLIVKAFREQQQEEEEGETASQDDPLL